MAEEKKRAKKPTALKRIKQSEQKNKLNSQFKSKAKTALRNFKKAIENKEPKETITKQLNLIFSLIDKGVKKNIFKKNKANRIKAKCSGRV